MSCSYDWKYASTLTMVPLVSWAIITRGIPWALEAMMAATVAGTLWFIWTRPSHRSAYTGEPRTKATPTRP